MRDRHKHESQQEKIERVEGPAKKTGEERPALSPVEQFEQPKRFHSVFQLFAWVLYRKLETQNASVCIRKRRHPSLEIEAILPQQCLHALASSFVSLLAASSMTSNGR